ncbi:YheV family putative zinc ribbon protein [Arsenophonus endosymbiont of Bemisia tabaci]|nr:hypothetical protein ARSQ2_02159 [Arsenophonus endosymbiont of Bemisia tabaci Q2]
MSVIRKRFIAGAVCPKCQSQDTLMLWQKMHLITLNVKSVTIDNLRQ